MLSFKKNERTMARIKINSIATSVLKSYFKIEQNQIIKIFNWLEFHFRVRE